MAVQASKSISLTDLATGEAFKLSANQILNFTAINAGADTQLTYIGNRGAIVVREVGEAVATINTAAVRTQAVTLTDADSTVIYLHSDKIIFMDDLGATTQIIYNGNESSPKKYIVTENASAINTVAENTFAITIQESGATRYINNLFVDSIVTEDVGSLPTFTPTYKIKLESVATSAGGSGYTAATVAFSGGGVGAVLPTATATLTADAVTSITIDTAGSNITADVLVTINGDGAGATAVNVIHHILDTLPVTTAGSNLNTAPTITFSAGTITATATVTVDPSSQTATGTTITNVGSYLASAFPPTLTVAGGTGAQVVYNAQGTAFQVLQVAETADALQTTINAL